ncbi:hypothetical protein A3Q56_08139 [Intoshia linei]|uniref:Uncharacterized protein n=1 Tax=Intoshia linei TaxID=1819745 RepID=A0A177AQ46_9BILA|nr:hypothetical protein A3Q56_08139 [Intoshia linei]
MVSHYYRNVHAVVYVFDIFNRETFASLSYWIRQTSEHSSNIPSVVVGNKSDLLNSKNERCVTKEEARNFCDTYNVTYFEISSKDGSSQSQIDSIFMTIAYNIKDTEPLDTVRSLPRPKNQHHNGCCK